MDIEHIKNYSELKKILENASWQKFEKIVGKIFELHNYSVEVSKVVTFDENKRQYDVIAESEDYMVISDCKNWDNKRRIEHGLKKAVEDQIERIEMLDIDKIIYPLIVTSQRIPIEYFSGVPMVPVFKLNRFLLDFENNREKILSV